MRVRDLRAVLDELRSLFSTSGARSQEAVLDRVSGALREHDGKSLDAYLEQVGRSAGEAAGGEVVDAAQRLEEAGLDEAQFLAVLSGIKTNKNLKKGDLTRIAELYGAPPGRRSSSAKIVDAIKLAFYKKVYERDARAMARRARPV